MNLISSAVAWCFTWGKVCQYEGLSRPPSVWLSQTEGDDDWAERTVTWWGSSRLSSVEIFGDIFLYSFLESSMVWTLSRCYPLVGVHTHWFLKLERQKWHRGSVASAQSVSRFENSLVLGGTKSNSTNSASSSVTLYSGDVKDWHWKLTN